MRSSRRYRLWVPGAALLVAAAAGACGSQVTARFTPAHRLLVVHRGTVFAVQKSIGECGNPTSSNTRVVRANHPPPADCSPHKLLFEAIGLGHARIAGQIPCSGTGCEAVRGWIPVVVRRQ